MNRHKPMITAGQLFVLLFVSRLALTMLYSSKVSGIDSIWELLLPLLLMIPVSAVLFLPSMGLCHRGGVSVCEYSVQHFKFIGKGIPFLYAGYFLISAFYGLSAMYYFMTDILPEGVQAKMILTVLVLGCVYASARGVEAVARTAFVVFWLVIAAVTVLMIFLMPSYSSAQLTPSRYLSFSAIGEGLIFLLSRLSPVVSWNVLTPAVKGNVRRGAFLYAVFFCLSACFLVILFVGSAGDYLKNQQFQMFRAIDSSSVLQRLDPLFILIVVCSFFCQLTLFFISIAYSVQSVLPQLSFVKISLTSGVILLVSMLFLPSVSSALLSISVDIQAVLAVILMTGIPCAVLLHQKLKNKGKNGVSALKKTIRTASLLMIFVMLFSMTSGCSGSLQLNQRIIVQGIGVDRTEQGYRLLLLTLDTQDPQQDNAMEIVLTEGSTVAQAVSQLENQSGKKLLLNQCLFIMMNRQAASYREKTLSYFASSKEIPKTVNLMVSCQNAEETLLTAVKSFGSRSEDINALSDSKAVEQPVVHCTLLEDIAAGSEAQHSVIFPLIVQNTASQALNVSGSYLINGENYACMLSEEETTGYLLIEGKSGTLFPEMAESIESILVPYIEGGQLHLESRISVRWKSGTDEKEQENIRIRLKRAAEACFRKIILQNGCDVFSIEKHLRNEGTVLDENGKDLRRLLKTAVCSVTVA